MFGVDPALFDGVISTLVGGFVIVMEFRELSLAIDSSTWPTVQGEVEETGVVTDTSMRSTTFAPMVRYHYRVGDRQYVCDRLGFGGTVSTSFRSWAAKIADRYGQLRSVKVYVSPKDPMKAVLEPGVHWVCWFVLAIGTVFFAIGLVGLLSHFGIMETSINF